MLFRSEIEDYIRRYLLAAPVSVAVVPDGRDRRALNTADLQAK